MTFFAIIILKELWIFFLLALVVLFDGKTKCLSLRGNIKSLFSKVHPQLELLSFTAYLSDFKTRGRGVYMEFLAVP
jgi:hypothetical protein